MLRQLVQSAVITTLLCAATVIPATTLARTGDGAPAIGDTVLLSKHGNVPVVSIIDKGAEIFEEILKADQELYVDQAKSFGLARLVRHGLQMIVEGKKSGLYVELPAAARGKVVASSEDGDISNVPIWYEIEVTSGPLKGKRVWWSYQFNTRLLRLVEEPGYLYGLNQFKNDKPEAIHLAFDRSVWHVFKRRRKMATRT